MSSLKILHLSDLHIGNFRYPDDPNFLAVKICDNLNSEGHKVDIVVVTGDIFDGRSKTTKEDQKFAITFFNTLVKKLVEKDISSASFSKENILFVPGNHDLVRKEGKEFEKYDAFIKAFYPRGRTSPNITFSDKYNFFYKDPEKKVIMLGFNSCKIEIEKIKHDELAWIDKIDFSRFKNKETIKEKLKEFKINEKGNWDDYGYLDALEVDNLFTKLKNEVTNLDEYTIAALLHHHFYPFPEIINKLGDTSLIRNYPVVVDKFQREKVSIVLHGHKHLAIQRVITDNKYFDNPDSVIYVLAAGSIGCKDVYNPSFQWLRIYSAHEPKLAYCERYEFNDEELNAIKKFSLPPQKQDEKTLSSRLLETLQNESSDLYKRYINVTDDFEQVIQDNDIEKIIETISGLITMFKDINQELQRDPRLVFILLLSINYRVIFLSKVRDAKHPEKLDELLTKIRTAIKEIFPNGDYASNLTSFLSANQNSDIDKSYEKIIKNVRSTEKRYSSYISICLFFTDLFLDISKYGEFYFEKEGIKHKINIQLQKGSFYNDIPNQSISIVGNIDRRAIIFNFKCKNPTVHKIAVLIVKDFEMRLSKFEESLREINLKLYYIIPKVVPDKYDLENFHFDAYIPTLLPLLTGDNLYQQKEVFIRELVQNSIDAILLRKKITPDVDFNTDIIIELGIEKRRSKNVKYFKIIDNGIGMTKFTIERYFTSIGRSFYVSEEFDELKKEKNISYNAISNFGIGFLSSFMVCKEVLVHTKSILDEKTSLEIEIPNYDGCFFIRNKEKENFGTEVTLYADERNLFDFEKFETYINDTFFNVGLNISIIDNTNPGESFRKKSYNLKNELAESMMNSNKILFFVPFSPETGVKKIHWYKDFYQHNGLPEDTYGMYFDFSLMSENLSNSNITLNEGLKISKPFLPFRLKDISLFPHIYTNYPSSFIQLDVAREKINSFKANYMFKGFSNDILALLSEQVVDFLNKRNDIIANNTPKSINLIGLFFSQMKLDIVNKFFGLKLKLNNKNQIILSLVRNNFIPAGYNSKAECYINVFETEHTHNFVKFVQHNYQNSILYSSNINLKDRVKDLKARASAAQNSFDDLNEWSNSYENLDFEQGRYRRYYYTDDEGLSIKQNKVAVDMRLSEITGDIHYRLSFPVFDRYYSEFKKFKPSNEIINYLYIKFLERSMTSKGRHSRQEQKANDRVLLGLVHLISVLLSIFTIGDLENRDFILDF